MGPLFWERKDNIRVNGNVFWDAASMGPLFWERKDGPPSPDASPMRYALQWGRSFGSGKTPDVFSRGWHGELASMGPLFWERKDAGDR